MHITQKKINYTYLNIIRTKLNLRRVKEPKNNICQPFYQEVKKYLESNYKKVTKVKDYYKPNFKKDNWFSYYKEVKDFGVSDYDKNFSKNDFKKRSSRFKHRFDAFHISK